MKKQNIPVPKLDGLEIEKLFKSLPNFRDDSMKEFHLNNGKSIWIEIVNKWFYEGYKSLQTYNILPKENVDKDTALKVIQSMLKSWEPKHEDKITKTAFLMNEWFKLEVKKENIFKKVLMRLKIKI